MVKKIKYVKHKLITSFPDTCKKAGIIFLKNTKTKQPITWCITVKGKVFLKPLSY